MTCTYGGISCLDPAHTIANCEQLGYPLPWAGRANSFVCGQGPEPGRGLLLMFRGDLLSLNLNTLYPLVFSDGTRRVTLKNILFVRAYCATPGGRGDPTEAYWVELADKRQLCQRVGIDKAYNVRSVPGGSFFSATLNAGSPWIWTDMVADIWAAVGKLGTFPGVPFVPNGTPEGFAFWGSYAFDALNQVLDRLGCALDYNPIADTFSIVRIAVPDATAAATLKAVDPVCAWDSDPIESVRARVPIVARVTFTKQLAKPDTTGVSPFYAVELTDPTAGGPLAGSETGTVGLVFDDMPAIYDASGTLTNGAALTSRAQERATDYFRRVRQGRFYRSYIGGYSAPGLLPGAQLTATIWRDAGLGLLTECVRLPDNQDSVAAGGIPFAGLPGPGPGGGEGPPQGEGGATGPTLRTMPGFGGGGPYNYENVLLGMRQPEPPFYTEDYASRPPLVNQAALFAQQQLAVQNIDGTQLTPFARLVQANNTTTGGNGFIEWTDQGGLQGYLSWLGLLLYKEGTAVVGPRPILEVQDDGGVTGVAATTSDDAVNGRAVLKYSWKGLQVQDPGGTNYGPEPKLQVLAGGPNVSFTVADDPTNKRVKLTITSDVTTQVNDLSVGSEPVIDLKAGTGISLSGTDDAANGRTVITITNTAPEPGTGTGGNLQHFTGTTVASPGATVFDITNVHGLVGGLVIKNTSTTALLSYTFTATDMYGDTTTTTVNLGASTKISFNLLGNFGSGLASYPFKEIKLTIQDQTAGTHATYDIYLVQAT